MLHGIRSEILLLQAIPVITIQMSPSVSCCKQWRLDLLYKLVSGLILPFWNVWWGLLNSYTPHILQFWHGHTEGPTEADTCSFQ